MPSRITLADGGDGAERPFPRPSSGQFQVPCQKPPSEAGNLVQSVIDGVPCVRDPGRIDPDEPDPLRQVVAPRAVRMSVRTVRCREWVRLREEKRRLRTLPDPPVRGEPFAVIRGDRVGEFPERPGPPVMRSPAPTGSHDRVALPTADHRGMFRNVPSAGDRAAPGSVRRTLSAFPSRLHRFGFRSPARTGRHHGHDGGSTRGPPKDGPRGAADPGSAPGSGRHRLPLHRIPDGYGHLPRPGPTAGRCSDERPCARTGLPSPPTRLRRSPRRNVDRCRSVSRAVVLSPEPTCPAPRSDSDRSWSGDVSPRIPLTSGDECLGGEPVGGPRAGHR